MLKIGFLFSPVRFKFIYMERDRSVLVNNDIFFFLFPFLMNGPKIPFY